MLGFYGKYISRYYWVGIWVCNPPIWSEKWLVSKKTRPWQRHASGFFERRDSRRKAVGSSDSWSSVGSWNSSRIFCWYDGMGAGKVGTWKIITPPFFRYVKQIQVIFHICFDRHDILFKLSRGKKAGSKRNSPKGGGNPPALCPYRRIDCQTSTHTEKIPKLRKYLDTKPTQNTPTWRLGGGFKCFLFSPLPGEMIQFD